MRSAQRSLEPPPMFSTRDIVRFIVFISMAVVLALFINKAANPRTWMGITSNSAKDESLDDAPAPPQKKQLDPLVQFYAGQAAAYLTLGMNPTFNPRSIDLSTGGVIAFEHVPLPRDVASNQTGPKRRSPEPMMDFLLGARDREPFLVEAPDDPDHAYAKGDADARYHLIALAKTATVADLNADAQTNLRFTALRQRPQEFRGQIIQVTGNLISVEHFELKRPLTDGTRSIYHALIAETGRPDRAYFAVFTELPPGMPPENRWNQLFLGDVRFSGYYLKVVKLENSRENGKPFYYPVLVGKTLELPKSAPGFDWTGTLWIVGSLIAGILVLGIVGTLYFRKSDARYQAKMAELRHRKEGQSAGHEERSPFADPSALGNASWPGRNGVGGANDAHDPYHQN